MLKMGLVPIVGPVSGAGLRVGQLWPLVIGLFFLLIGCDNDSRSQNEMALIDEGQNIFRYDTYGNEVFWTDTLRMHEVIESAVGPATALAVGLKVDSDALPEGVLDNADLSDPATTVLLIELDAVVGLKGTVEEVNGRKRLTSVGITCALCHSTVDDSVAPGIGKRLDGWANRDVNPGLILSLSPALQDVNSQSVLQSWGPGKYDAYWNLDGLNDPSVIPPAFGLKTVDLATYTGEGDITYWNAYVAVTQMGGRGNFEDDRLGLNITHSPDLVTTKLAPLRAYQFSLPAAKPPENSFDIAAAARGKSLFQERAGCGQCHQGEALSDGKLYEPQQVGQDATLALRGTTGRYRTTPLIGLWQHPPYFHNGSADTLTDVIAHYDEVFSLGLSNTEAIDLEHYLRSL